ncbi:hypothetical protein AVEN_167920-1 [Araneus ventricosus]|uniref:Uncharacterized protein n=1 Tax=Araneus ventricosus TaxID=182803 RepID=A0A4Y2FY78_ARAVE|nr:hypothetical protein AVEN_167920-1 [Araneus ventricosus]
MINKPRATSDEGNQLKRLQLRSGKTAVISTTTEACTSPMRGDFTLLAFSLSVWVLVWSGLDGDNLSLVIYNENPTPGHHEYMEEKPMVGGFSLLEVGAITV